MLSKPCDEQVVLEQIQRRMDLYAESAIARLPPEDRATLHKMVAQGEATDLEAWSLALGQGQPGQALLSRLLHHAALTLDFARLQTWVHKPG